MSANDPPAAQQSRQWAAVALGAGLLVGLAVGQFEPASVAEVTGYSTVVVMFIGWFFWAERHRVWFWAFLAAMLVAHGTAIIMVPWPSHGEMDWLGPILCLSDLVLMGLVGQLAHYLAVKARERGLAV